MAILLTTQAQVLLPQQSSRVTSTPSTDFDGTLEADAITVGGANLTTIYSPIAGSSSIVTTGALNAGSITSGFTSIDVGSGAISTTGTVTTGVVNSTVTAATGVSIDQNYSVTDASNTTCLSIDFDKTGTSTTNNTMIGINLDMDSTAATGGTNTMTGIKVTPTLTQASGSAQNFTIKGNGGHCDRLRITGRVCRSCS